jgi:hypothetical protein
LRAHFDPGAACGKALVILYEVKQRQLQR